MMLCRSMGPSLSPKGCLLMEDMFESLLLWLHLDLVYRNTLLIYMASLHAVILYRVARVEIITCRTLFNRPWPLTSPKVHT